MVDLNPLPDLGPVSMENRGQRRYQRVKATPYTGDIDADRRLAADLRYEEQQLDARLRELGPWWSAPSREWRRTLKKIQAVRQNLIRAEQRLSLHIRG